jgi:hypothetical protein
LSDFVLDVTKQALAGLLVAGVVWFFTWAVKTFTNYTVIIVHKEAWRAFKSVTPKLHDMITTGKKFEGKNESRP